LPNKRARRPFHFSLAVEFLNALFALSVAGLFAGCGPTPTTEVDWHSFDGKRAFNHVRALVEMGPHPSGSSTLTRASSYIASQLQEAGLVAEEQVFMAGSPRMVRAGPGR